jgi:hypothetical protein
MDKCPENAPDLVKQWYAAGCPKSTLPISEKTNDALLPLANEREMYFDDFGRIRFRWKEHAHV